MYQPSGRLRALETLKKLGSVVYTQFTVDILRMSFQGIIRNIESRTNHLTWITAQQKIKDLFLTIGQSVII